MLLRWRGGCSHAWNFGAKIVECLLESLELTLRLLACSLRLLISLEELLDGAIEIREVEPDRRQEECSVEQEGEQPPPDRAAAQFVEQAIIILREAVDLFEQRLMRGRGHRQILPHLFHAPGRNRTHISPLGRDCSIH